MRPYFRPAIVTRWGLSSWSGETSSRWDADSDGGKTGRPWPPLGGNPQDTCPGTGACQARLHVACQADVGLATGGPGGAGRARTHGPVWPVAALTGLHGEFTVTARGRKGAAGAGEGGRAFCWPCLPGRPPVGQLGSHLDPQPLADLPRSTASKTDQRVKNSSSVTHFLVSFLHIC